MIDNIDKQVVDDFGKEWDHYHQSVNQKEFKDAF
tara:strand:- start:88 stop:189 length:102 start_codon:yes stop_codon:yes gene_type:complete